MAKRLRVLIEAGKKRVFACAVDLPGLARSARTEDAAIEALIDALSRYAPVATAADLPFDRGVAVGDVDVVERVEGNATTDFGAPGIVAEVDREPVTETEGRQLAAVVGAAWALFADAAARAPETLRKGPRGGGRDRAEIVAHVAGADRAYASVMGVRDTGESRRTIEDVRREMLEVLRRESDGSPLAARRWPPRYAARRAAWHALDHAWETEDRSS